MISTWKYTTCNRSLALLWHGRRPRSMAPARMPSSAHTIQIAGTAAAAKTAIGGSTKPGLMRWISRLWNERSTVLFHETASTRPDAGRCFRRRRSCKVGCRRAMLSAMPAEVLGRFMQNTVYKTALRSRCRYVLSRRISAVPSYGRLDGVVLVFESGIAEGFPSDPALLFAAGSFRTCAKYCCTYC